MRTNYVLIDFESVQPEQLASLDLDHFKVMLFVGSQQTKLPFELAAAIQRLGPRAEYVKISGNGPNALDFHIAFYIGRMAATDKTAYFHIISKDKGFDPLIEHLKTKRILVSRARDISEIPLIRATNAKSRDQRLEIVVARLRQLQNAKPRAMKTLRSTIESLFQKQLSESEVAEILDALQSQGLVTAGDKKLIYALPTDG